MYQITFQFENGGKPVIVDATPNTTILDAAKAANVAIDAPCNGNGSCGKCRVKILEGTVESTPTHHISEEDYAAGWRLSCASKPASDVVVQVPDIASAYQSRMKTADLSTGEEVATFNKLQEDIRAAGVEISCDFVSAVLEPLSRRWTIPCPTPSVWSLPHRLHDGCTEVKLTYHTVKKLKRCARQPRSRLPVRSTWAF
ncbi:MAG: 2Fe-2S iron-sulfur cluster-binding protein [Oscillospiraceae bacterium]